MVVSLVAFSCTDDDDDVKNYLGNGDYLPEIDLSGPYGDLTNASFDGKRGMLVFFTSYCPDCHNLMPAVKEVWDELGDDPEYIIASVSRVSGSETPERVYKWWRGEEKEGDKVYDPMPYYLDMGQQLFNQFGNMAIPRIYITDPDGKIVWMSVGRSDYTAEFLMSKLQGE